MARITRKEMFTDDDDAIENYEEPPVKPSSAPKTNLGYDQRIQVLDTIEKLEIPDKTLKGHLMEYVFSEDVLKKLSTKSKKEKEQFVEETYKSMATSMPSDTFDAPPSVTKETMSPPPVEPAHNSSVNSIISEIGKKIDQAIGYLKNVESSLSEIKTISVPAPAVKKQDAPKTIERFTQQGVVSGEVDGFENIRGYALYN